MITNTTIQVGYTPNETTTITVTPTINQLVELQCIGKKFKQWYTTGSKVTPTPNEISTKSGNTKILAFSSFTPSHAGTYTCLASTGDTQTKTTYPVVLGECKQVNIMQTGIPSQIEYRQLACTVTSIAS